MPYNFHAYPSSCPLRVIPRCGLNLDCKSSWVKEVLKCCKGAKPCYLISSSIKAKPLWNTYNKFSLADYLHVNKHQNLMINIYSVFFLQKRAYCRTILATTLSLGSSWRMQNEVGNRENSKKGTQKLIPKYRRVINKLFLYKWALTFWISFPQYPNESNMNRYKHISKQLF